MTLFRYILTQLLVGFAFALAGLGLVIVPTLTVSAVNKVGGVGLAGILEYMPLVLVELVPYVLPMAFLLACVATFGRLASDNEFTAIRMAGVSPLRLLLPGLLLACVLCFVTDWLISTVSPNWKHRARSFQNEAKIESWKRALENRNEADLGEFSLWAESSHGNVKENVVLTFGGDENPMTITAERMTMDIAEEVLTVSLENAESVNESVQSMSANPVFKFTMDDLIKRKGKESHKPKYRTSAQLKLDLTDPELEAERGDEIRYLIQSRHALAMTYFLFLLLGIPTGIMLRAGTQLAAFTAAMGYAFVYYVLSMRLGKTLAEWGSIGPEVAAWATNGMFLVLGIYLLRRGLMR